MATKAITTETFDEVIKESPVPVLVDFWAPWCGGCRALGPTVEEISDELADKLAVYKCDVDKDPELPGRFGIVSIPTLLLFKGGELVMTMVANHPKAEIMAELEKHI